MPQEEFLRAKALEVRDTPTCAPGAEVPENVPQARVLPTNITVTVQGNADTVAEVLQPITGRMQSAPLAKAAIYANTATVLESAQPVTEPVNGKTNTKAKATYKFYYTLHLQAL